MVQQNPITPEPTEHGLKNDDDKAVAQKGDMAWEGAELENPHAQVDKPERVQRMFTSIAHSYDLNNRVHSFWRDQHWRRAAVSIAEVGTGERVLDVACGTGDLTFAFARAVSGVGGKGGGNGGGNGGGVVGVDFTREMLELAEYKRARLMKGRRREVAGLTRFAWGDAMDLEFEDASFDVVSIAFGIRNVADPGRAMREFVRVLKPGGRVVVLEFAQPGNGLIRAMNRWYSGWLMPRTATLISRDRSGAYRYLPKSIDTFMNSSQMKACMGEAGLGDLRVHLMTLGVCACYRGTKPATKA